MPLSEKARIEVYLPDSPAEKYRDLLKLLDKDFTYGFGGCSIYHEVDGSYLSHAGSWIKEPVSVIQTDTPFTFDQNWEALDRYVAELRDLALAYLDEETILVVVQQVFHSIP